MVGAKDTGILVQGYNKQNFKKGDKVVIMENLGDKYKVCLLYTSDAADDSTEV